jgi:hypothetical protein
LVDSDVHVAGYADVERAGGTSHDVGVAGFHVGMILHSSSSGTYSVILSDAQRSRRTRKKHRYRCLSYLLPWHSAAVCSKERCERLWWMELIGVLRLRVSRSEPLRSG